jgi:hypothetical protein
MSSFVVDRAHINAMINAGFSHDKLTWYHDGKHHELNYDNADAVGQMLLDENIKAVQERYPDSEVTHLPGRSDAEYLLPFTHKLMYGVSTVQGLKLIDSYEYQASDDSEWGSSEACAFCEALRRHLIRRLPGYEAAEWEWTKWPEENLTRLI